MENFKGYSKEDMCRLVGSPEQIYSVKKYTVDEGKGKGNSIYQVVTGGQLQYDISIDNCMDLANLSYKGVNISFISKNGSLVSPHTSENGVSSFPYVFNGGMLYTCGLLNTGGSVVDEDGSFHPTHGRIHAIPAQNTGVDIQNGTITVKGTSYETALFGHSLELQRTITSKIGSSIIEIDDVLTNNTPADEEYVIIYHMNFGFPFLSPSLKVKLPENIKTVPVTEHAAEYTGRETEMTMPIDGEEETLFTHTIDESKRGGMSYVVLENPDLGIGTKLGYKTDTLPVMAQWRCMRSGEYVLGIEPTNSYILNRKNERANGTIGHIKAFESIKMHVELEFYDL